jgi:hypothetical protein
VPRDERSFREKLAEHLYFRNMLPFGFAIPYPSVAHIVKERYREEADEIIKLFRDHVKEND